MTDRGREHITHDSIQSVNVGVDSRPANSPWSIEDLRLLSVEVWFGMTQRCSTVINPKGTLETSRLESTVPVRAAAADPDQLSSLVELTRSDPNRAAPMLFDRFGPMVDRLVWNLLGADVDHEDIVQQVFMTVIARIDDLREPRKLAGWVKSVAVNTAIGALRKRRPLELFGLVEPAAYRVRDLTTDVETRDLIARVRRVLDKFPPKERITFLLHYAEEMTLEEVASACDCSHSTAKRRLAAADRRFQRLIDADPHLRDLLVREPRAGNT